MPENHDAMLRWGMGGSLGGVLALIVWIGFAYLRSSPPEVILGQPPAEAALKQPTVPFSVDPPILTAGIITKSDRLDAALGATAAAPLPAPAVKAAPSPCVKYAYRVRSPKREFLFDDMAAKYQAAYINANQRLAAIQKCLREGSHGHDG